MGMNFKRFLSLLLAFVMVLGMFPMGHAHAAEVNRVAYAKVRNGNRLVSLNDCLYTFSQQENGTWLISAQVGENTVHVDPHGGSGNAGKPSRTHETFITLKDGYTDNAVKFFEENGGYLHVHTEKAASAANWNQCTGDHTDSNAHDVFLYRPVGENEASSQEIPGYVLVEVVVSDEGVTGISSGDRLLIVGKHNDDSISVLHPSTSTNNGDDHIAVLEIVEEVENLGLTVTARFTSNRLSWNASPNTSYNVERSADNVAWEQIATVTTGAYLDETAGQGTQYFYRVSDGTETTNGVQGHVTGMAALKEVAVLVYEGDGTVFDGSNKVAIADGEKASELNTLHSGTIIYKAYFANENGLSGKQAVLGTDTGLFVGFEGAKFRHELGAGFSGGPSVSNLKNNASNTGAFSYDDTKNTGNWILVSNGADATVVNLDNSKFSLLGNTGATTYYAGGSSAQSFNGTINYILVLSEVLSGNELKTLTGLNLNHNEEQHTWANATCTAPKTCSVCGLTEGEANGHTYTNDCDSTCNVCGEPREGVQEFDSEKLTITDWEASQHDTTEAAYKKLPEYAFDGKYCTAEDYTSFWATVEDGNIADQYLIAKLGEALLVNQIKITQRWYPGVGYNCTGKLLNYFIWVKTDADTDWTCVAQGDTQEGTTTVTFEYPVVATQIKLTSTSSQGNKVMNVAEFEIFKAVCKNGEHTPNEDDGDCLTPVTCSVCNTVTTPGKENHTFDEGEVTTAPTCTTDGERIFKCTVEGCTKSRTEIIPATHDAIIHVEAKDATCTEAGNIEYWYCADCGAAWLDAERTQPTTAEETVISALGHCWDRENAGYCATHYYCCKCSKATNPNYNTVVYFDNTETKWETVKAVYWFGNEINGWAVSQGEKDGIHTFLIHDDAVSIDFRNGGSGAETIRTRRFEVVNNTAYDANLFVIYFQENSAWDKIMVTGATDESYDTILSHSISATLEDGKHVLYMDEDASVMMATFYLGDTLVYRCQFDVVEGKTYFYPECNHAYDDGAVTEAPTCTETGIKTFTCSICGDSYTESIPATGNHTPGEPVEENRTAAGYDLVTKCSVCFTELERKLMADKVVMLGKEVRLESEIQMQYRVYIPESLFNSGAYVVMAKTGAYGVVTKTYTVSELNVGENLVTMGVAPAEITAPISITVYNGDNVAQDLYSRSGEKLENASRTVAGYAVELLKDEDSTSKLKDLAVALLTYGGYAQQYFGVDAENPAFNMLPEGYEVPDLSNITAETLKDYKNTQTNANMGVKATTIATYVDSNIRIRVYLAVEDDINAYTFKLTVPVGNEVVEKSVEPGYDQASGRYYVDITEIASAYIDFEYQITITGADGTNVITASVLAYARSVLSKSADEKLLNLAKALYLYNQAANAYYGV